MKYAFTCCIAVAAIVLSLSSNAQFAQAQEKSSTTEKPAAAAKQEATTQPEKQKPAAEKKEAPSIAGNWQIKSGTRSGAKIPAERLTAIKINEKEITIPAGPDNTFVMSYKLDTSKSPFDIDMKIESGPVPDGTAKGIVSLDGNKMKLCYNGMGGDRPAKFETAADDNCFLFELEKEMPKLTDKTLPGTWTIIEGTRAGKKSSPERIAGDIVIDKESIKIGEGESGFTMSYKLNLEKSPAEIDMKVTAGPAPVGSPAVGIVGFNDKGNLVLCYDGMGGARPVKFESTEDNNCFLFVMKMKK